MKFVKIPFFFYEIYQNRSAQADRLITKSIQFKNYKNCIIQLKAINVRTSQKFNSIYTSTKVVQFSINIKFKTPTQEIGKTNLNFTDEF